MPVLLKILSTNHQGSPFIYPLPAWVCFGGHLSRKEKCIDDSKYVLWIFFTVLAACCFLHVRVWLDSVFQQVDTFCPM